MADEDICTLTDAFDLQPGEGRRWVSWIWQMCGYNEQATENEGDGGFQESEHLPISKNRSVITEVLCGSGKSFSKTGMVH